ncbi:hypothetical protein K470DRAFT_268607 [Piedraia hortae CBS 480.64]|uniref:Transcription factor TFIIIC triple barrel domain-containing protein n=1 Tax=Piedraia hortae CBS 480.64 TaxID=1314780 RepID=A0A6A7C6J5_9PEZI|nr:hypothetical protein K470DRAFT_268607 [Piedraia hortae CBS 480.64]
MTEQREWEYEYEYHEGETEDIYFTLDLSTHVDKSTKAPSTFTRQSRNRTKRKRDKVQESAEASARADSTDTGPSQLQILGLHTTSPVVQCDNQCFECEWYTDFGAQVYISEPGIVEPVLQKGRCIDVVGVSRLRLVGKPVEVAMSGPKPKKAKKAMVEHQRVHLGIIAESSDDEEPEPPLGERAQEHASFMENLVAEQTSSAQTHSSFLSRLQTISR